MTDITLTDTQAQVIKQIKNWYQKRTKEQQIFKLFGFAGTGKTTITKLAIQELGLSLDSIVGDVKFCAFTGKAALVMRRSGTPAQTIHSLIYSVKEATEAEIAALKDKIETKKDEAMSLHGGERFAADRVIRDLEIKLKKARQPQFGLNLESPLRDAKLLVLDECSMLNAEIAADLLSFGKPMLVLGDPGQLPPIKGEGAFTNGEPDVMLTEIHRQAAESPIIRLATMARRGERIPYGEHGTGDSAAWKLRKDQIDPAALLAGQVICGRNATRLALNTALRRAAGFDADNPIPSGPQEKVICLKNRNDIGLINGCFLELSDIGTLGEVSFRAVVKTEDGEYPAGVDLLGNNEFMDIYSGHFEDHVNLDTERADRDWRRKKGLVEATFGWVITCHKAQGSAFDPTIIYDDHLSRTEDDRRRWMYTGITRAVEKLLILD
jgi:exodeoxyribonuclease V